MDMYQFVKKIGQSRYGDVWLVKGSNTKRNYALKRIDFHQFTKREQQAAHSEAKLLCTIKHPNIVTYLDSFFNCKGSLFIVMSYCEKGNLHDLIRNRNGIFFKEDEIINWLVQICMALKYLHDQKILHRDLKTQNIFLSKQNLVKVGDFGIARLFNPADNVSSSLFSTPSYTSPEVVFGERFSQKSDVWSLGCCGYEIAALNYAFTLQDMSLSMQSVIDSKLSSIAENYSTQLICLISFMLNVEPDKRPSATTLLLNDYIRKHILLFLKDSGHSNNSSQDCRCRRKRTTSSGVNSDSSSTTNSSQESRLSGFSKISENMFKTVPDVNGNGDGNDNSQQQALNKDLPWSTKTIPISVGCKPKSGTSSSSGATERSTITFCKGDPSVLKINGCPVSNMKQFEKRLQLQFQKSKSENSFQLLNSLTNSLNVSRFNSMESICDHQLLNCKYSYGENPPKSAENLFLISQRLDYEILKRPATSAIDYLNVTDALHLPQIRENTCDGSGVKKLPNINLPPLYSSSDFSTQKNETLSRLPNLEESIVDKFLLRNIIESTKSKKKENTAPKEDTQ